MARVIGTAAIRLEVDGQGLGASIKREVSRAAKESFSGGDLFRDADESADKASKGIGSKFSAMFGKLTSLGQGLGSVLASGARLVSIGAAAGVALAGVTSLVGGIGGLVTVIGQASGVAAVLPAAFAGFIALQATISLGTKGIGDSFKALASGDVQKFNESLKGLAPEAQGFLKAAQGLKPAFDKMQIGVQQELFRGLGGELKTLGSNYLPVARDVFGNIAIAANMAAKEATGFLNSTGPITQLTETVGPNLGQAFQNLVPAIRPVIDAILNLVTVGSDFLPGLGGGIANVAQQFGDFINGIADSGALGDFIQNAIDTVKQLGKVIANVFSIFGDVFASAQTAGGGFLNNLLQITGQIKEFTSSAAGAATLSTFFSSMRDVLSAVLPVVIEVAKVFGGVLVPVLANLATQILPALVPVIQAIGPALFAAAPGISALAGGFASFISAMAPVIPVVGQLVGVLGGALGSIFTALGPVIANIATTLGTVLAGAIPPLVPLITQIVQGLGGLLSAVLPLLGPIIQLATAALGPLLTIVQALIPPFTQVAQSVFAALQPVIPVLAQAFGTLGAALAPLAGALGQAFVSIFTALTPLIGPLAGLVATLVAALVPLLQPIIALIPLVTSIIGLFVNIAVVIINLIVSAITPVITAFTFLATLVTTAMTAVFEVITSVVNGITGIFNTLAGIVSSIWNGITSSITGAVSKVGSAISSGFSAAVGFVKTAFTNIVSAVTGGISTAISVVASLPGKILSALGNFGSLLLGVGRDLLMGLINGITGAVKAVIDKVIGIGKSILGAIKGALGISSPSKEMAKVGVFIGQGLIQGIDKITPAVNNTAAALANSVTAAMSAPLNSPTFSVAGGRSGTGATTAATAGNSLVQNNYMLPGTDVNQFAQTVLQRGSTDLLSGASTFSVQRQGVQAGVNDGFLAGVIL